MSPKTKADIINMGDVEAAGKEEFDLIPRGVKALFNVEQSEVRYAKDGGAPYVAYGASIVEDDNENAYEGRWVFGACFFTVKDGDAKKLASTLGRTKSTYEAIVGDTFSASGDADELAGIVAADIADKQFTATIGQRKRGDGEGKDNNLRNIGLASDWASEGDLPF